MRRTFTLAGLAGCSCLCHRAPKPRLQRNSHAGLRLPQSTAGIFTGLAIALHNLPEGLATFVGALNDTKVGASIAAAIFIHNVSWAGRGRCPLCSQGANVKCSLM